MSKYVPRLRKHYEDAVPELKKKLGIQNKMQIPKLEKIVLNICQGQAVQSAKILEAAVAELAAISGQKPIMTKSKKSIAGFKLRAGMPIGCSVTLRSDRMYDFLDRLINITIPRVRDFRGISAKAFDGHGNYSLGLKEQIVFPEIDYDKVDTLRGIGITIVTTAKNDVQAKELLEIFNFPLRKK